MVDTIALRKDLAKLESPALLAFGDPLLHTHIVLKNNDLARKHDLPIGEKVEVPNEKIQDLLNDLPHELVSTVYKTAHEHQLTKYEVTPGGSAQNILRILQWLCKDNRKTNIGTYYGTIGNDTDGKVLQMLSNSNGLDTRYIIHPHLPTGVCVSLINGMHPTVVKSSGAATAYSLDDLKKVDLPLDATKILYIESSFVIHSSTVAQELVKQAEEKNIVIVFNISDINALKDHHVTICEMIACANIVFASCKEMIALAQILNFKYNSVTDIPFLLNTLKRITISVCNKTSEDWLRNGGIYVMSQGATAPTIMVWGKRQYIEVVPVTPKGTFIDKTGARDGLIAGFIAGVLAQWDPKHCLEYGCTIASFIVTKLGVTFPADVPPHYVLQ